MTRTHKMVEHKNRKKRKKERLMFQFASCLNALNFITFYISIFSL
jgi:hypothetical protein